MSDDAQNEKHKKKMENLKKHQDAKRDAATKEKGLLIVYTGNGKGKSTAAFGNAIRALGHGMQVELIQFLKGTWETGEKAYFAGDIPGLTHYYYGKGFTWDTQDRPSDTEVSQTVWEKCKAAIANPDNDLVIMDEINIALRYGYIDLEDVCDVLSKRRADLHVIATGRNAKPELIAIADLVTEMKLIKHPYQEQGVKAQKGIEY